MVEDETERPAASRGEPDQDSENTGDDEEVWEGNVYDKSGTEKYCWTGYSVLLQVSEYH